MKTDLLPSDTEITAIEVFVEVMRPIIEITEVHSISGETTSSQVNKPTPSSETL